MPHPQLEDQADKLEKANKGEEVEDLDAEVDPLDIQRLDNEAEIFDSKASELERLHQGLKVSLGDFDAFEVRWQPISQSN